MAPDARRDAHHTEAHAGMQAGLHSGSRDSTRAESPLSLHRGPSRPLIIAHRGGSLEAPENTLGALQHGVTCGADWQEVDVTLTRDGVAVLLHDETVERTTDGQGDVEALDFAAVTNLPAGQPKWSPEASARLQNMGLAPAQFGARYRGERVPSLAAALAVPGVRLMLELKVTSRPEALARAAVRAVHAANMSARVILGSFDVATMQAVAAADPTLTRIGIVDDEAMLAPFFRLGVAALAADAAIVTPALARRLTRRAGYQGERMALWTWTVYTPMAARALDAMGVDGLITDIPQGICSVYAPAS